jgi:hypothetical protein
VSPPAYSWAQPGRSFGVWDGLMLWGLLNSLSSASSRFFYDNQNSAAYRQWRADADRSAQQDPDLRAKLGDLDRRMAQLQGQPQAPGSPPPATKPPPLGAEPQPRAAAQSGGGGGGILLIGLLLAAAVVLLWFRRRRLQGGGTAARASVPVALRGSSATRFRVGMTFPVDPSPFLLAANATKVQGIAGSGMVSIEAIGVLMDGTIPLNRLYLPARESFFQIHLDRAGEPDECRYFSRLDEVTPASDEEWGAWLDPAQGMIGWPQFQTKDGQIYDRVWAPGGARIAPRETTETIEDLSGTTSRRLASMLYGRPTGLAVPASTTEYVLVSAVDAPGQAYVEIHAGIDINPAQLSLPAVKLD